MNKKISFIFLMLILILFGCSGDNQQESVDSYNKEMDLYLNSVDEMPFPIGGMNAIHKKVVYPKSARKAGVEGVVFVKTFVNTVGEVTKTEILKGIGSGCDEAAAKAVRGTNFTPGRMYGEPVNVQVIVPIRFELM